MTDNTVGYKPSTLGYINAEIANTQYPAGYKPKNKIITLLLCLFGLHRFYVGRIKSGILLFLLYIFLVGAIWVIMDFIHIILNEFTDANGYSLKK